MDKLSVIGLGKLGACTGACFASKNFEVLGVDVNKDFVDAVNEGKAPVYEPGLQELITSSKGRLRATQWHGDAIRQSDITFLIVPTPSEKDGHFSNKYLISALEPLSVELKKSNKDYHLFVITSTVSPGATGESLIPLIEMYSGRKLNEGFGVCYNPEFIALGSVIKDFLNPDMVLIGESNEFAGRRLARVYETMCENEPFIARMSIINAEVTKISLNSFVTMKISFANTLANICESIPGADIDRITRALGADKRVSPYYLKGSLGYGGQCFPRDNRAFAAFARKYGCDAVLAKATDSVNRLQAERMVKRIYGCITENNSNTVSVLGLAYKPNTPVIEESPSVAIIEGLLQKGLKLIVYDSMAADNVKIHLGDKLRYASSVRECFSGSSVCVITLPSDEFRHIDDSYIIHDPTTVIDCWRILDPSRLGKKVRYIAIGRCCL